MPVSLPSNFGRKLASCLDPPDLRPGLPQQGENERESEHVGGVPVSVCVRERERKRVSCWCIATERLHALVGEKNHQSAQSELASTSAVISAV